MLRVAEAYAYKHPQTFSMEVWGGATFDVALRFLHEDPWKRLKTITRGHTQHITANANSR
jgi:pyruvate carboxylase